MELRLRQFWFFILSSAFLFILLALLIKYTGFFMPVMTIIIVIATAGIITYAGLDKFYFLVPLLLPISVVMNISGESTLIFPSEAISASIALAVIFIWIKKPSSFNSFSREPVTLLLLFYLVSLLMVVPFSEMPVVSLKSVIVHFIYVIAFYGGSYILLKSRQVKTEILKYYLLPLLAIVIFVLARHSSFEFSKDVAGFVTKPFYQDHTIYSAVISFFLPLLVYFSYKAKQLPKLLFCLTVLLFTVALFIAGSRAAWLSIAFSAFFFLLLKFRTSLTSYVCLLITVVVILISQSSSLVTMLKMNRNDSNAKNAGIAEQTRSVANITNDQSNSERINRWKCAWRMFLEKPLTGFGPGTYQFSYLSFQREYEMTRISVKSPYNIVEGRGGTAHNEYLLVLSEAGVFPALFFIFAIIAVFSKAIDHINKTRNTQLETIAMLLALSTLIFHFLFNNFLDTDKAAFLFYFAFAWLTARINTTAHEK
jgi:putative inorganic carbon (hco3(-)) transporter